jgi:hypothetical protein
MFALPTTLPVQKMRHFGGWLRDDIGPQYETVNAAWPTRWKANQPASMERFKGFVGAPYFPAHEYAWLRRSFKFRDLRAARPPAPESLSSFIVEPPSPTPTP